MQHILRDNVFEFDGEMFREVNGMAMSTRMAVACAGLLWPISKNDSSNH